MEYETLLLGTLLGASVALAVIAITAAQLERSDKCDKAVALKNNEIKALEEQLEDAKGIITYRTDIGWRIAATKVSEREGRNTRFYMGDKLVGSVSPGSSYCVVS